MTLAERGLEVIERLKDVRLSYDQQGHLRLDKCPHCGRRKEMSIKKTSWLLALTGLPKGHPEGPVLYVPRYEVLPCCSTKYIKEVEGVSKKQRLQMIEDMKRRKDAKV